MKRFPGLLSAFLFVAGAFSLAASDLVILQTNDTHSQLEPNDKGLGGIQRRKAIIDSVRAADPNVLLVDAGDAVQGTLFFNLYKGEAEMEMMNLLGYDMAILGNHEFDNGVEQLVKNIADSRHTTWLSTNYHFDDALLDSVFVPYKIYDIDGKRIGFIGINTNPKGMISEGNYDGVHYLDVIKAANATAWALKNNENVDAVVAITHIGYDDVHPSDVDLARSSEDIDIILGGHSHTLIQPGSGREWVDNAVGRPVLVVQNGRGGGAMSQVTIDLDSIGKKAPQFKQYTVDSRYDGKSYPVVDEKLSSYRKDVDRMMANPIGRSSKTMEPDDPALLNFVSDFIFLKGTELLGHKPDLALANKGSLRTGLPKGTITEGEIITMQPFANHIVALEIKGGELAKAFDVMASRYGDGVSSGVEAVYDPATKKCTSITINGKPLDPDATYTVATIDYLANGGDYMEPLTTGKQIIQSKGVVFDDLISYIKSLKNKPIKPSDKQRMHQ